MRRNCFIVFGIWLALVAAYVFFLREWLEPPALIVAALSMGTAMTFAVMMFNAARHSIRDAEARERLMRGERPRDGAFVAAAGELRPMLDPLRAPFSERECLLYAYEIRTVIDREMRAKDYVGYAFTRCSVHTPYGSFALGSFPVMEGFGFELGNQKAAARYVDETKFTRMESVITIAKAAYGLHSMPPPLRIDWAIGTSPESLEHCIPTETIVANGARVVAYGRYSARDQSIVGDVQLRPQEAQNVRDASALGRCIASLMLIGSAHLILWAVLTKIS